MSTEVIVFPDVEQIVCDWLAPQLSARSWPVPVGTRVPSPRPARFVRVMVVGGVRHNLVQDNPSLVYEAWAGTETDASALARLTRGLLHSMPGQVIGGAMVYRVDDFAGPQNLPDPTTAQVRYTGTISILLRGSAA